MTECDLSGPGVEQIEGSHVGVLGAGGKQGWVAKGGQGRLGDSSLSLGLGKKPLLF